MNKTIPKHLDVKNRISKAIRQGIIVDKLPGERTLAKQYGVSYMTLRKAVDNLVAEGLLYRVPKMGTFVMSQDDRIPDLSQVGRKHLVDAIRLIAEIPGDTTGSHGTPSDQANPKALEKQALKDTSLLQRLERENRELKRANEILKKVATYFAETEQGRSAS